MNSHMTPDPRHDPDTTSDDWGAPIAPEGRRKKLSAVVSVRFTSDELERLRSALPDGNLSNFIRLAALSAIEPPAPRRIVVTTHNLSYTSQMPPSGNFPGFDQSASGAVIMGDLVTATR